MEVGKRRVGIGVVGRQGQAEGIRVRTGEPSHWRVSRIDCLREDEVRGRNV